MFFPATSDRLTVPDMYKNVYTGRRGVLRKARGGALLSFASIGGASPDGSSSSSGDARRSEVSESGGARKRRTTPRPPAATSGAGATLRGARDPKNDADERPSPFPIEDFEARRFPTSARFLWASRGLTAGTGLKPLDVESNWLEQDGDEFAAAAWKGNGDPSSSTSVDGDADPSFASFHDANSNWVREMKLRHELIASNEGCVVWDESASEAAEALLPIMCDWLVRRQPWRYKRCADGGVAVPSLDGWRTGPLEVLRGKDALTTAACLVQEELCLVREETMEERRRKEKDAVDKRKRMGLIGYTLDGAKARSASREEKKARGDEDGGEVDDAEIDEADGTRHTFEAGVVCFSFDPRKRHHKTLAQVHRPVPGYEEKMRRAVARVFTNLREDRPLWRANWVLQNSPEVVSTDLEWHPSNVAIGGVANRAKAAAKVSEEAADVFADERHTGYMDPLADLPRTPAEAARNMHLRVEYETVRRLPGPRRETSRWILFTVRTHIDPIGDLDPPTAAALHLAMTRTPQPELEYKSLGNKPLRDVVAAFLRERAAEGGVDVDGDAPGSSAANNVVAPGPRDTNEGKNMTGSGSGDGRNVAGSDNGMDTKCPFFRGSTSIEMAGGAQVEEESKCKKGKDELKKKYEQEKDELKKKYKQEKDELKKKYKQEVEELKRKYNMDDEEEHKEKEEKRKKEKDEEKEKGKNGKKNKEKEKTKEKEKEKKKEKKVKEKEERDKQDEKDTTRAAAAVAAGIEPWPSAAEGVAAASTPPASWYFDDTAVPSLEEARVFGRSWQAVGRADQVAIPGSYFTGTVGKVKYLVVRGMDDKLRAFHNVCRHHAMEVASAPGDRSPGSVDSTDRDADADKDGSCSPSVASCFECPYHGWTYDLTGSLIKATRLTGIEDFDVKKNGLKPLAVEQWGPFIFCQLGGELAPPPLSEWLGEGGRRVMEAGIGHLRFVARREYHMGCNWKVFCDNYLDGGYHVPFAHPALNNGVDMKSYQTTVHGRDRLTRTLRAGTSQMRDSITSFHDASTNVYALRDMTGRRYSKATSRCKRWEARRIWWQRPFLCQILRKHPPRLPQFPLLTAPLMDLFLCLPPPHSSLPPLLPLEVPDHTSFPNVPPVTCLLLVQPMSVLETRQCTPSCIQIS